MSLTLKEIYNLFPKEIDAVEFLETVLWNNKPICPYCKTSFYTPIKGESRYHCNKCNTNFSVTVNTLFHRSKVDLRKWFYCLMVAGVEKISLRKLGEELEVTKDTVAKMIKRIRFRYQNNQQLIQSIQNKLSNG